MFVCVFSSLAGWKRVALTETGKTGGEEDCLVGVLDRKSKIFLWIFNFEMTIRHSCKDAKKSR